MRAPIVRKRRQVSRRAQSGNVPTNPVLWGLFAILGYYSVLLFGSFESGDGFEKCTPTDLPPWWRRC